MQWSLIAVVLIVNALFGASCASAENGKGQISSVFEAFGYSPACVASALTSCEFSSTKELSVDVVDSIEVTKSLLQEMKSEIKAICQEKSAEENSSSVIKSLLQEIKSDRENSMSVLNSLLQEMKSEMKAVRQEMKSEIKAIRQEMKSAEENSKSEVKSLLQEMKSEIIAISQELKSAEENSSSVVKSLLQEMKSAEENSSSVVKSLLQEINSADENSSSVLKSLLQEMKSAEENSSSVVKSLLQEMKSEIKVIIQEVKIEQQNEKRKSDKLEAVINSKLKNCADLRVLLGDEFSGGVQTVYPYGFPDTRQATVFCDQVTYRGGWTVIQSRSPLPIRENFTRSWNEYVEGFGDLKGEFWLGLDNIHALTNSAEMALLVDMEDDEGKKAFALYRTFHVGDAASEYVLRVEGYSGTAGDGMTPSDNNMKFSTQDNDNDLHSGLNCAEQYKGGWWYNRCSDAHLNGLPIVGKDLNQEGITWSPFRRWNPFRDRWPHSMKKATMRIRPVSLGF